MNDKIISLFIEDPNKEFHVREVAKIAHLSPTTASKYLSMLCKEGLLESRKMSNHIMYHAAYSSEGYKRIKRSHNLNVLHDSGLINHLVDKLNEPEAIVLFGSFLRGEDIPSSDIDLFVVGHAKKDLDLGRFEARLKRKVQLFIHPRKDISLMKRKNKELLNNIINGLVVYGYLEVFS